MTHFAIATRVGKGYSTIHDRITALSEQGVVERKGETKETQNKQATTLWGLSSIGLWVAAHDDSKPLAREQCGRTILERWRRFTEIYKLDKLQTKRPAYQKFTEWLRSDQGVLHFLDTFGAYPLTDEEAGLGTFRRMIELALLYRHGAWVIPLLGRAKFGPASFGPRTHQFYTQYSGTSDPYLLLGEIATKHEKFRKLDAVLREIDAPLQAHYNRIAYDILVGRLRPPLGDAVAKKLAATPFFTKHYDPFDTDFQAEEIGPSLETLRLTYLGGFENFGLELGIDPERVVIYKAAGLPYKISPEWMAYCELRILPITDKGRTKVITPRKQRR